MQSRGPRENSHELFRMRIIDKALGKKLIGFVPQRRMAVHSHDMNGENNRGSSHSVTLERFIDIWMVSGDATRGWIQAKGFLQDGIEIGTLL
jgi:hypothetical protein